MPSTAGHQVRTVADIFMVLTQCTRKEADEAELEICRSPKAMAILATACGISTSAIGSGGKLAVAGMATGGSVSIAGIALAGAGLYGAKKTCTALVKQLKNTKNELGQ